MVNHRNAKFYDLRIKASCKYKINDKFEKNQLSPLALDVIAGQINKLYESNKGIQYKKGGVCYYLADCLYDIENSKLLLLINKSDSTEPDPTISNPETKDRKVLEKPEGYGNDYSAHVLISLKSIEQDENIYLLVYETVRGSGIYGTHIRTFINKLLKSCREENSSSYLVPHPSGSMTNGKSDTVNSLHSCELSGKISDDFLNDLNNGFLEGIELIDYDDKGKKWDVSGSISESKKSISLTVSSQPEKIAETLSGIFGKANKGKYREAKVRFRDDRDAPQSVSLFTDDFTLVNDDKYVKRTKIQVRVNDKFGFESIHGEIKNELYKIL